MRYRCQKPSHGKYRIYGARGIKVCKQWCLLGGEGFRNFVADVGTRPPGKTLDRIDNNGNYEPGNVRWATAKEQKINSRCIVMVTIANKTQCFTDWARELNRHQSTLWCHMVKYGLTPYQEVEWRVNAAS